MKPEDGRLFHLFFVPFVSEVCRKKLKDLEILERFQTIKDLPILVFPHETDVLSMERPELFRVIKFLIKFRFQIFFFISEFC